MHSIAWWSTLFVVAVATITDLRSRRIPNWLVLPYLVMGFVVSGWLYGVHGIVQSLVGLGVGGFLFGILSWMGGMGMGDVKLSAAIGVWVGPSQMLVALVFTGIAGGIIVLCWAAAGGFLGEMFDGASGILFRSKRQGGGPNSELALSNPTARKIPYAPAIAIGAVLSFFSR